MVTNVTPVEQDDSAALALIETTEQVLGFDPANPGAGHGPANKITQGVANTLLYLKKRVGVQGTWDMTPGIAPITPGTAQEATSVLSAGEVYTFTPVSGTSTLKATRGLTPVYSAGATGRKWAKFVLPVQTAGDNQNAFGFVIANVGATFADIEATIAAFPVMQGTVTSLMMCVAVSTGIGTWNVQMYACSPTFGSASVGAAADGDTVYVGLDYTTGDCVAQINAGTVATVVSDLPGLAAVTVQMMASYAANPVVFTTGSVAFSYGTTTGGKVAFSGATDPTPPTGAADGKKYLVSVAGSYGGRAAAVGDIVEFHSTLAAIQITPAITLTSADVSAVAAALIAAAAPAAWQLNTYARLAAQRARIIDISNDGSATTPTDVGDAIIVGGTPAGAWSAYTAYSLAVWDGAAWHNLTTGYEGIVFECGGGWVGPVGMKITHDIRMYNQPQQLMTGTTLGSAMELESYLVTANWFLIHDQEMPTINGDSTGYTLSTPGGTVNVTALANMATVDLNTTYGNVYVSDSWPTANEYMMLLRLRNIGATKCDVNISCWGGTGRYLALAPNEERLCVVVRDHTNASVMLFNDIGCASTWVAPTLATGWTDVGGTEQVAQYRKQGNMVHIRMNIEAGVGATATLFTLPVGFRPPNDLQLICAVDDSTAVPDFGHMLITASTGVVSLQHPNAINQHKVRGYFTFDTALG